MKKYLLTAAIILIISIALGVSIKSCSNLKEEKTRLENNQDVLIKSNTLFKVKDSLNATKINALTLNLSSAKEYYQRLIKEAKEAGVKEGRINSITELGTNTSDTIIVRLKDSIIIYDTLKCFDYNDEFMDMKGCIRNDSLSLNYSNTDSLIQFVSRVPKQWWFFKWGTKAIQQTIISKNPKTKFTYQKYIEIK
jgi:hypothetical protein